MFNSIFDKIKPKLWLFPQGAVYFGALPINRLHTHRALQVLISPNSVIEVDQGPGTKMVGAQAVVIHPFVRHRVKTHWKPAFSLFFDPGFLVRKVADEQKHTFPFPVNFKSSLTPNLNSKKLSINTVKEIYESCAESAGFHLRPGTIPVTADARINSVLSGINSNLMACSFKEALKMTDLSPSRFTHLFTEQTGMSFRSYILWIKLMRAIEFLSEKNNLTDSAHEAGFSDSAHFSRIFSRTFGFPPSFLKYTHIECVDELKKTPQLY